MRNFQYRILQLIPCLGITPEMLQEKIHHIRIMKEPTEYCQCCRKFRQWNIYAEYSSMEEYYIPFGFLLCDKCVVQRIYILKNNVFYKLENIPKSMEDIWMLIKFVHPKLWINLPHYGFRKPLSDIFLGYDDW